MPCFSFCGRSRSRVSRRLLGLTASCLFAATHAHGGAVVADAEAAKRLGVRFDVNKILGMADMAPGKKNPGISEMKKFFVRYGYLNVGAETGQAFDMSDSHVVRAFQKQAGLLVSGILDKATRTTMASPRCGMPDVDPLAASAVGPWQQRQLTYAFGTLSKQLNAATCRSAVSRAFQTWSQYGVRFREAAPAEMPDILVEWRPANDPDRTLVGQSIAHADYPPSYWLVVKTLPLPIHFDDDEVRWTDGFDGIESAELKWDIETTALHEIGHTLGLEHDDDPGAVMHHRVRPNSLRRAPEPLDLKNLLLLYPGDRAQAGTGPAPWDALQLVRSTR
jgi:hypothetical protein